MEEVSNIVKERLRRAQAVGAHPDADVLSAFAEKALSEREREGVVAHLASCADCREIVFVALPSATEELASTVPQRKAGWLSLPVLKWGTAAALAVIVGAAALLLKPAPTHHANIEEYAATRSESANAPTVPAPASAGSAAEQAGSLVANKSQPAQPGSKQSEAKQFSTKNDIAAKTEPLAPTVEAQKSEAGAQMFREQRVPAVSAPSRTATRRDENQSAMAAPGAPSPALALPSPALAPQSGDNKAGNELRAGDATLANALKKNGVRSSNTSGVPSSAANSAEKDATDGAASDALFLKAKPPQAGEVVPAPPTSAQATSRLVLNQPSARAKQNALDEYAGSAMWRISEGSLQRSVDAGKSWNNVSVASNVALRVVSSTGQHVWAGGDSGRLYHSSDAGLTWSSVTPAAGDARLSGDISTLQFADPQHGKVSTTSGETWTTADAGQTWQKQ
jgi:hypothetical protein